MFITMRPFVFWESDQGDGGGGSDPSDSDNADDKGSGDKDDSAGLKSALEAERKARKTADKRIRDLERQISEASDSGKSEVEKLSAKLEALERERAADRARIRTAEAKEQVTKAAKTAGATDTDLIWRIARADIEFDDDDEPINIASVIESIKSDHGDLFKAKKPGPGDGGQGTHRQESKSNDWLRASIDQQRE